MRSILLSLTLMWSPLALYAGSMDTIGWVEQVQLLPEGFEVRAKIDTGADNSSLDVKNWEIFHKNGREWVRFEIYNNGNDSILLERVLERYAKIKRKGTEPLVRPVVSMRLCIGDLAYIAPVNLARRGKFKYRMLVGRSFLKGKFLVDSAKKLTRMPTCIRPG